MNGESRSPFILHRSSFIVLLLFLAARVPLLFLRQPFYDELFTQWISAKSFAGILDALRFDSGPPLYYWLLVLLLPYARALAAAVVLYAPAVWLALHQPRAAMGWMKAWAYPDALFVRPPMLLAIAIAVFMLVAMLNVGRALARPNRLKPVLH